MAENQRRKRKAKPDNFKTFFDKTPAEFRDRLPNRKRQYLQGLFQVERIVTVRGSGQRKEYLIQWQGWDMSNCTWEPEKNIPEALIEALYNNPDVTDERVQKAMTGFLTALKGKLKSNSLDPRLTWDVDHDVYRYLFKGKGTASRLQGAVMLEREDFTMMSLPPSWYYCLDKNGEGREVEFPIRAKPVVKRSPKHILDNAGVLVKAPEYIFEVVSLNITKKPCSVDSLT